jgi:hypothetical protein
MSGESPIAAITSVTAIFSYAIVQLTTEPLNPGHPSFAMILAFFGASAGAAWELIATRPGTRVRDRVSAIRDRAFWVSFAAGWIGILVYIGCLVSTIL